GEALVEGHLLAAHEPHAQPVHAVEGALRTHLRRWPARRERVGDGEARRRVGRWGEKGVAPGNGRRGEEDGDEQTRRGPRRGDGAHGAEVGSCGGRKEPRMESGRELLHESVL